MSLWRADARPPHPAAARPPSPTRGEGYLLINQFNLTAALLQQTCVYLVIAFLMSRTPLFIPLMHVTIRFPHKVACYLVFSLFCVLGTYFGLKVDDSIANTRAIGAGLSGILGGPWVGIAVGLTGGLHRYSMGGMSAFACAISTVISGLLGGMVHRYMIESGRIDQLFEPLRVAIVSLCSEIIHMAVILLLAKPFDAAAKLVEDIAIPMLIANTLGAALFMRILLDRREMFEKQSGVFSSMALKIASRSVGVLRSGFNQENTMQVARIIYEETGVGAVAISDREKLLAFIGVGDDHHLPGMPITSSQTLQAVANNEILYADGNEQVYQCSIRADCKLGASLVIPLHDEEEKVIGAINLYEPRTKLFSTINRALGEGIARLLSTQILAGRYEQQKQLLTQSEIKLLQAQVNPHFLFNALNTLSAVIRVDPVKARHLVQNLSTFFRKNLKRSSEEASLSDEIEHVNAYLQIELARFSPHLSVDIDMPEDLRGARLPAFTLQPIVENAIKHGTSQLMCDGLIRIDAVRDRDDLVISIEDNAGLYEKSPGGDGMGMSLVDRRIKNRYGDSYGIEIVCERDRYTRVNLRVPLEAAHP
jgi:two-component system LytT family sensor kinase